MSAVRVAVSVISDVIGKYVALVSGTSSLNVVAALQSRSSLSRPIDEGRHISTEYDRSKAQI